MTFSQGMELTTPRPSVGPEPAGWAGGSVAVLTLRKVNCCEEQIAPLETVQGYTGLGELRISSREKMGFSRLMRYARGMCKHQLSS